MRRRPLLSSGSLGAFAACLVMAAITGCGKSGGAGGEGGSAGRPTGGATGEGGTRGSGGVAGSSSEGSGGGSSAGGVAGTGGVTGAGGGRGGTSGSGGASSGTGGSTGLGGASSSGGRTGTGGIGNSGGVGATGGVTGVGGGRGGSTGSGGIIAAGGAIGTGGATAAGGATGTGGGRGGAAGSGGASDGRGGTTGSGGGGGTTSSCPPGATPTGGRQYCSNSKGSAGGRYSYELWAEGSGSGCMTVYGVDAKYSATWSNVEDFLARVGLQFDQTKTPAQIGTITSDFAETKTADSGLVYVGIYGWTLTPLREYYIIEDWGSTKPAGTASDGTPRTHAGTITVDGDSYDVWTHTRENKPNITGTDQTFDQYFSVRQTARQCGHISVSEHFTQWTNLGLQLGKLTEATLLLEAQDGTGSIVFTTATVVLK
jgi:endo-1,4-beta-xylanase